MPSPRSGPDKCPGALQVHVAADGPLARVRIPGGVVTSPQLQALAAAAQEIGKGEIELTSRGNLQLRALRDPDDFARRIEAVGLLPSTTHERVRNILASPLSGRIGGHADVRGLVTALDRGLCDDPALADLPGRTLFTIDDGSGDVSGLRGDLGVHALSDGRFALILAGADTGARLAEIDAVEVLLTAARTFDEIRGDAWRLSEVPGGTERVLEGLGLENDGEPLALPDAPGPGPIGWLDQPDGGVTLAGGLAFGTLPARLAEFLAAVEKPIVITPWRSVLLSDLDEWTAEQVVRVLAPMGLIFDENSPYLQVSACVGQPGCARSHTDVRADARAAIEGDDLPTQGRQHWSGCDRKCGRPHGEVTDVVAGPDGYRSTASRHDGTENGPS
ncbi:precorrin-3B synthase [Rhodococcus xishaensis]|uniref:Precorrin-3B synthase n=1 Tax=Rhodococcus xishaensis TaxID=2487364 RepID=A0A438AZP4_9NOCA|nr:precorrin-3B synthase [Rhodococcus xishaensis]RVW04195.1 precorrin-3B synthase [Rhodococcus xishaensis]